MGSDALLKRDGHKFTLGDNFHISISAESNEEADKLYYGLADAGKIEMPIADTTWGSYFGMLADKFGIQWTVDFDPKYNGPTENKNKVY